MSNKRLDNSLKVMRRKLVAGPNLLRTNKKKVFAYVPVAAGLMLVVSLLASGTLVSSNTVSSTGVVATIGLAIYSDYGCTQTLTSIDWGTIVPGGSVSRTIFVKNTGTVPETLGLSTSNWSPSSANSQIALTWNLEGRVLTPGQAASGTLNLVVSPSSSGISFGMDIVIAGTA